MTYGFALLLLNDYIIILWLCVVYRGGISDKDLAVPRVVLQQGDNFIPKTAKSMV